MDCREIYEALIVGVKDYFHKNNLNKAVIGLSGGVDSSVASFLAVKSLGSKSVTGILMPDAGTTSKENMEDAKVIAKKLKISYKIFPINDFLDSFKKTSGLKRDKYAEANAKARIRMMLLYYSANLNNALVIGTSDKSEIALGYTTKYGDNASDILVIGDLWKTEVIEMGKFLGVPHSILRKKPSAELIKGQTAEKELGASYEVLDKILRMHIEQDLSKKEIIEKGFNKKIVQNVIKRIRTNEHKRRSPVIIRVSEKSFHGMEWRMPITNRFKG